MCVSFCSETVYCAEIIKKNLTPASTKVGVKLRFCHMAASGNS